MQESCRAIHAEQDAILKAKRRKLTDGIMYVAGKYGDGKPFVTNDRFYCTLCSRYLSQTDLLGVVTHTSEGPKFRIMKDIISESYMNKEG